MTARYGSINVGWIPWAMTPATAILDASGDKIGGVFMAQKDGTIDRLAAYCTAVAGSVPSYDFRLESVTNGFPSGSLIAANTNGGQVPTATTLHLVTMTASHIVAAGDLVAMVLNSASATGANNATFNGRVDSGPLLAGADYDWFWPRYAQDFSVGTYSAPSGHASFGPVYSDGSYMSWFSGNLANANNDFNIDSTPDERGNRWTQVGNERCIGALLYLRWVNADADFNVHLYAVADGDSASPIASFTADYTIYNRSTTFQDWFPVYWDGVNLTDGADYRIACVPTTTSSVRPAVSYTAPSEAARQQMSHGYLTTRTRTANGNAGTWTDTVAAYTLGCVPIFDQSNAGGGSGGGVIIAGRGGLAGYGY
jgi:hypothetical protein